jgi:solute carrier family 35 protein C2
MSIAGIAKEVATISVSAIVFGDELTPLNITGVAVTVCGESRHHLVRTGFARAPRLSWISQDSYHSVGIGLFTHHNYRKRLQSDIPLDPHGQPLDPEDDAGLGQGSIALRDSYRERSDGHSDSGTAAVRSRYHLAVTYTEASNVY